MSTFNEVLDKELEKFIKEQNSQEAIDLKMDLSNYEMNLLSNFVEQLKTNLPTYQDTWGRKLIL